MNYRYPGPQSFTEEDEQLFFGRNRETKVLYDLIMVQPLVVLFAKSGMGKTSLLQAGIIPRLRFTEYDPVMLRLNDIAVAPELQVLRKMALNAASDTTLWTEIIHYNSEYKGTPLLIFDQFEEVFTLYSDEQRAAFVRQLADVINGTLPESIRQRIREGLDAGTLDTAAVAELERKPRVKIVLSIRSDLLHYLHLLSPEIPSILRNRFELLGLRPEQAEEAIVKPAAQAQEAGDYASPTFQYTPEALAQILSYLSRRQQSLLSTTRQEPEIESFQLQLLCEYIERKVIAERATFSTPHAALVTPDFYGSEPGIEQILSQFYSNTLAAIPDTRQREKARRLLEDHLMKNERRVSVDETTIVQTHGVSSETLDLLVNKRLLRQDVRETGEYFEVSHDTLLGPILRSKAEWEAKQAAKRVRRLVGLVLGLLLIVAGAVVFGRRAFVQKIVAQKTTLTVYANDLAYKSTIALRDGDRNTAFRIAEFAHRYVEADNPSVVQALIDALYYNDNFDTTTYLPRVTNLEGHISTLTCVAFSPDGKLLATGSKDKTAKIWDLSSGKALINLEGHTQPISSVAFSPDGKKLATGSEDKTAKIWGLASDKALITLEGHTAPVTSVMFSLDGKMLATAGNYDKTVKIWGLASGKALTTPKGLNSFVYSSAFSSDGKWLATTGNNNDMPEIWDLASGKLTILEYPYAYSSIVYSIAFSPDGKRIATGRGGSNDDEVYTAEIWNLEPGDALRILKGHTSDVKCVAFSPDGKRLATGSDDKTAKIWDLESGTQTLNLSGHGSSVTSLAFSSNGKMLATGSDDKTAKIWDLASGKSLATLQGHNSIIWSLAYSPRGERLATGSSDKTKIWNLASSKTLTTLEDPNSVVYSVTFSPDGKRLATGGSDKMAKIWDLVSGKALTILEGHTHMVWSVAFSPDGKTLATGSWDKTAKIWDLKSGKAIITLQGHTSRVIGVAFSPDGKRLATGAWDETAKIWDLDSGKAILSLKGHTSSVKSVAFSPDGKRLATGAWDKTAKIWDLASGKILTTLKGHTNRVYTVAFSPDGKRLATGCYDKTAKIWDLESGKSLITLKGYNYPIYSVAFSPDGKRLAAGGGTVYIEDNTAKIWELTADALIQRWHSMSRPAGLNLHYLQQYNLETLLDLHPNNEAKLIATGEIWQIKAFADLAAAQAGGSNVLSKVSPSYARAERLYAAALALQDELLIRMDYANMLRRWAEVYQSDGLEKKAAALRAKADRLWKEAKE